MQRKDGGFFIEDEEVMSSMKTAMYIGAGIIILKSILWTPIIIRTFK